MTRINVGIEPAELTDKHLIAEHREIKRIPNCIKKGRYNMKGQPDKFTLNTGHVKFFYDKLGYLSKRYNALHSECLKRGFKVTNYSSCFEGLPLCMMKDYKPTFDDRNLLLIRIKERNEKKQSI